MIGIIGGYGNIGLHAGGTLKKNLDEPFRIAGRNFAHASKEAQELYKQDEWYQIKENTREEWAGFCKSLRLILCCADLKKDFMVLLNEIAAENSCPVVYVSINKPEQVKAEGTFIYGAGSIPGLSGILPQYLRREFDSVCSQDFYYGAREVFSCTAARDYVEGLMSNTNYSMAMWKKDKVVPYEQAVKNPKVEDVFRGMKYFPYFDEESQYVSNKLHLREGRWHMCIHGEHTIKKLERVRFDYAKDPEKAIADICQASKLDCFGIQKRAAFVCNMEGMCGTELQKKTLILTCEDSSKLTGSVAAVTALLVWEQEMEKGQYLLCEAKQNCKVVEKLLKVNEEVRMEIINDDEQSLEVEGEI